MPTNIYSLGRDFLPPGGVAGFPERLFMMLKCVIISIKYYDSFLKNEYLVALEVSPRALEVSLWV